MFEFKGFTQKANRALNLAVEAAQNMGHRYVGTEHVLYGLAAEGSGVAAAALEQCGISAQTIQSKMMTPIGDEVDQNVDDAEAQQSKVTFVTVPMLKRETTVELAYDEVVRED